MRAFNDASLMIDTLEENPRGLRFTAFVSVSEREWCFSALVRMECRVRALSQSDALRLTQIEAILVPMTRLPLTDQVFERAALVRAQTSLKTPDALHVAMALVHGCGELWTADARMARATVPGLAIRLVA